MKQAFLIVLLVIGLCLMPAPLLLRPRHEEHRHWVVRPTRFECFAANVASAIGWRPHWVQDIQYREFIRTVGPIRVHGGLGPGGP